LLFYGCQLSILVRGLLSAATVTLSLMVLLGMAQKYYICWSVTKSIFMTVENGAGLCVFVMIWHGLLESPFRNLKALS